MDKVPSSEITSKDNYLSRRKFIKRAAIIGSGALVGGGYLYNRFQTRMVQTEAASALVAEALPEAGSLVDEMGDPLNSFEDIANFNNYYEFTTDKQGVARLSAGFPTSPWQVEVGGLVNNPGVYDIDDLRTKWDQEERIYRMRCVEGWSMVIPWVGFPLHKLLAEVEPTSDATHVRFETLHAPDLMPGQSTPWYEWPYVEGLRLDEAMNGLAILSTGLYGESLLPQNGAPIRLVVPWKYGFKGIKSIVKINLVDYRPVTLWMAAAPNEYGFVSNVQPDVPHPRWSQATERRIGELGRRETLPFNGYADQVAHLYEGMDLSQHNA